MAQESKFERRCVSLMRNSGWLVYKVRGLVAGLPDRLAIKNGRHVWVEFKGPGCDLSRRQWFRILELVSSGAEVLLARPCKDRCIEVRRYLPQSSGPVGSSLSLGCERRNMDWKGFGAFCRSLR